MDISKTCKLRFLEIPSKMMILLPCKNRYCRLSKVYNFYILVILL